MSGGVYREEWRPCVTLIAPFDVQLFNDDRTCVQPDILVLCNRDRLRPERLSGVPDLVVEIASPSNWRMDAVMNRQKYLEAGVREYWIVFPEDKKILVYRFEGQESRCSSCIFYEKTADGQKDRVPFSTFVL